MGLSQGRRGRAPAWEARKGGDKDLDHAAGSWPLPPNPCFPRAHHWPGQEQRRLGPSGTNFLAERQPRLA